MWVASACGAVPSGAVAAGIYDNEVIWVARAMHRYLEIAIYDHVICVLDHM